MDTGSQSTGLEATGGNVKTTIRIKSGDPIYMVTDPQSNTAVLEDICGLTTLASIGRQVLGGLDISNERATIYVGRNAEVMAKADAKARLLRVRLAAYGIAGSK